VWIDFGATSNISTSLNFFNVVWHHVKIWHSCRITNFLL